MSEGPIRTEREAWEPVRVTTNPKVSVHYFADGGRRGYCGRKLPVTSLTHRLVRVNCSDCLAALQADGVLS